MSIYPRGLGRTQIPLAVDEQKRFKYLKNKQLPQRQINLIQPKRTPYYALTLQCKLPSQQYSLIKIKKFCYFVG